MLTGVRVVLVETSHAGNLGAVARAMKTMGLNDLRLVAPRAPLDDAAYARASGADDILDQARPLPDLAAALADCRWVVGASARSRHLPWPLMSPREMASAAVRMLPAGPVALVLGREDRGLSNEELHLCHHHVQIPANPEFGSLNLAAAVQVLCYELRLRTLEVKPAEEKAPWGTAWDSPPATSGDLERLFAHLEETLVDIDFLDPQNPRALMPRLRRLYLRAHPDEVEVGILRGILTATQKGVKNKGD